MNKMTFLLLALLVLGSCKDKIYNKYLAYVPIYEEYGTFRNNIKFEAPRAIVNEGNIYQKDHFMFIVENGEGIHFIDNSNTSAPSKVGFLKIQGCDGMSIKDNYLYASHLIDVTIVDISNFSQPIVAGQVEDIFPDAFPIHDYKYPTAAIDKEKGVVVGWEVAETKEEVSSNNPIINNCPNCETFLALNSNNASSGSPSIGSGISGSISKFAVANDYLYIMHRNGLYPIDISIPLSPITSDPTVIWQNVETLFPHENNLFMGTTTGMLIYSLSTPSAPTQLSIVSHMTACDPVVVQDDYAFVTVRSGTACNGGTMNQLDVIDISDLTNPILKESFQMNNPHGLGIDGNVLFICDGSAGLKVFDASDPLTCGTQLIQEFSNIQATDIIPHNNVAAMIGNDGLYQYDYSNPNSIQFLSKINFQ